ncbi:hypothetical protein HWD32_gp73 [Gordonia phage Secretariat]|uniref:Uncharacterized protein n=1 Tax=Gordonia phage Secretariat TaxID=2725616 RepID=A0A6M3SWZ0_9CAUD|nr:hypothetical protein HWD32_gp73 [Gordonia phage Secretariat]QJD49648.1 hypothetical protein SEA_SECRETARIAT_73 [Gordonia phage Secretariat]
MGEVLTNETEQENHTIRLGVGRPPHAECTCTWKTEPNESLIELGFAAFDHAAETGHELRKLPEDE